MASRRWNRRSSEQWRSQRATGGRAFSEAIEEVNSGGSPFGCVAVTQLVAHTDCLVQQRVRRVCPADLLRCRNDGVERVTQRFVARSESCGRDCRSRGAPVGAVSADGPPEVGRTLGSYGDKISASDDAPWSVRTELSATCSVTPPDSLKSRRNP